MLIVNKDQKCLLINLFFLNSYLIECPYLAGGDQNNLPVNNRQIWIQRFVCKNCNILLMECYYTFNYKDCCIFCPAFGCCAPNFGELGYRLEIRSRVKSKKSVTQVESKLDIENPKSCSVEAWIPARFQLARISSFIHEYWLV